MRRLAEGLYQVALTAWVGGTWIVGYLVVPLLFESMGDRQHAGAIAGRMFATMGWFGLGCAAYLLIFQYYRWRQKALRLAGFWLVMAMASMAMTNQFGIQPLMAELKMEAWPRDVMGSPLQDRFAAWHGASSLLYLAQSVLGLALVIAAGRELK